MKIANKSRILFCAICGLIHAATFAQIRPFGFVSQDSLLQIYYVPKARWADSIMRIIERYAEGHTSEEVYQTVRTFYQKKDTAAVLPVSFGMSAHHAVLHEDSKPRKAVKKKKNKSGGKTH